MRNILFGVICGFLIVADVFAIKTYGPTTKDDSLWRIAEEIRPDETISVQQVMIALINHNRGSFYRYNVNSLEAGKILELPSNEKIREISKIKAYQEVQNHNRQWKKLKEDLPASKHKKAKKLVHKKVARKVVKKAVSPIIVPNVSINEEQRQVVQPIQNEQDAQLITEVKDRLVAVEEKNESIRETVNSINDHMNFIEQSIEQLKMQDQQIIENSFSQLVDRCVVKPLKNLIVCFSPGPFCASVIFFVLLFIVFFIKIRRKKSKRCCNVSSMLDQDECFSNVDTQECVAVKLNLARAYIDMGKPNEASSILNEVLINGSDDEKEEARNLLEKIENTK